MKKITDFIVEKRVFFLITLVIFSIVSLFLIKKVNINDDIMEYLPKTSETKIGKDIMDSNFLKEDTSVLNVMFKDLTNEEKDETLKKLENIEGVSNVLYENTNQYNKDNYTLYVLNVSDYADSKTAKNVYDYVNDNFKIAGMNGSIYDENKPILQLWIVILAIAFAMIILTILSDSYIEPWLYLFSIGIAVFINKGTNIMFNSVSSITNSIVAILQLALSMDYSIMLSNRYKQEKETHSNKKEAMKEALFQSFKAISSSSVTTIVGLIALVFMSFTIGKDLGFVLAKGVLLSLISIFFSLPALLLMFDNLILKTKKKTPKFNLNKLGSFIFKTRYVEALLIIILFVGAFLLKGNINILFTSSEQDKVGKVFPVNNQLAIVYNNKYENVIRDYCQELEKDKKIDQVLCYSNTINEKLAYNELNNKFAELNQNVSIEEYLIKVIYYNYYHRELNNKMTLNEFITFIKSDILPNKNFAKSLNSETKNNIKLLENFTIPSLINKKRSSQEIATILNMDEKDVNKILIYFNSKNENITLSMNEFINFLLNDVMNDSTYKSYLDSNTIDKLEKLQNFTNVSFINNKKTKDELSEIMGMNKNDMEQLFLFYTITNDSNSLLTIKDFSLTALQMANDETYKNYFNPDMINSLNMIKELTENYNVTLPREELYQMFGVPSNAKSLLNYFLPEFMTPDEFATKLLETSLIASALTNEQKILLTKAKYIMANVDTKYSFIDLAESLDLDKSLVNVIYGVYDYNKEEVKLTPKELVEFILNNKNNALLKDKLASHINEISIINEVMRASINEKKYTSLELSNLLAIQINKIKLLFSLYDSKYLKNNEEISLNDFINVIMTELINNEEYANNFDNLKKSKLQAVNKIINNTIDKEKYTAQEVYDTLSILSNNLDKSLIELVYIYYGSNKEFNESWQMTIEEFVNYLNSDILDSKRYNDFITEEKRDTIIASKKSVDKAKQLLVANDYSRAILNTLYTPEGEDTYQFVEEIEKKIGVYDDIYVVGNSKMAVEMNKTFNGELNKITLLTMLFIFIVVAITFKDLIIPIVLILIIQTAVYTTMSVISLTGGSVYFIAILIVQAILMGATIDYAIVYTSYYREERLKVGVKEAIINAYNKSIHTIISSGTILIIVTLVVAYFAEAIAAKICETISEGTLVAVLLILFVLPGVLATTDKFICRKNYFKKGKLNK